MTEDYTIQQQRPSATPYVIGGAGLGAGAGLLVNKWAAKPMSHEDIVNEMNDKDKFEANVKEGAENKASWEEVKKKHDALKSAETALETAKEKANNVTAERKVDENAVKTAEEKVKNAKEAFETETKNLAEKLGKKPLMNKWLAMGIGAAALTLGALAVRPKAKEV